jgi:Raf kinase inhibitor-like YbhB/YbcL family protein
MKISSKDFPHRGKIPPEFAFGRIGDAGEPCALSANRNPHLAWDEVPEGTKSFALICVDPDAPSRGDDVNIAGRSVSALLPRTEFYHWAVADLPADLREIAAGSASDGVTVRGKSAAPIAGSGRQGINDYTGWFASDADMRGDYCGYDGPCPPFNDEIPHRYFFRLFALDVPHLELPENFTASQLLKAIKGHVLAEATTYGVYSLNPKLI